MLYIQIYMKHRCNQNTSYGEDMKVNMAIKTTFQQK